MCTIPESYHEVEFTEVKQYIITKFIFQGFVRIRTKQEFVEFNTFCSVFLILHRGPHFAHRWFKHLFMATAWNSIFGKLSILLKLCPSPEATHSEAVIHGFTTKSEHCTIVKNTHMLYQIQSTPSRTDPF